MFALKRLNLNIGRKLIRFYATIYEKQFTVVPFCNLKVNLPFNVSIVPLDVHKYKDYDKIFVRLVAKNEREVEAKLEYSHDKENVSIRSESKSFSDQITCKIEAPIKANIDVNTDTGNISLLNFNGESISLKSKSGNITASRCHCEKITIESCSGNIICFHVMQAAEIHLKTQKSGSIMTDRLQGLVLKVETENGNVETKSSYCNDSRFSTDNGCLNLRNTHKDCLVIIKQKGKINITAFDGSLKALLNEAEADIQLTRIQSDSEVKMESGVLRMKLSKECLENASFKIIARDVEVHDELKKHLDYSNDGVFLGYVGKTKANMLIDCKQSSVTVQGASWMDMFNIKSPVSP